MKQIFFLGGCFITIFTVIACNQENATSEKTEAKTETAISQDSLIKKGEYIVLTSGCNDCHTPKKMGQHGPELDEALLFSGHPAQMPLPKIDPAAVKDWVLFNQNLTAFAGPWGVSFAANISSDATGIGNWTEEQFFRALREGKSKGLEGGRSLMPPMPWESFGKKSDEDLRAIFAYLKSTKPVKNLVPAYIPPAQPLASK
jgi:cytochrome c2